MHNTVNEHGVRFLVHFTQASNLSSIFQNGILPISDLAARNMPYRWNDAYRFDDCYNAACFSIGMPNYKMFYKYRNESPQLDWIVLGIKKDVLWEKNCAFCVENAASKTITQTSVESRKGVHAFRRLYEEFPNKPTREALKLHPSVPTNPQAEVLIFGNVEPQYIFSVAFENTEIRDRYKQFVPSNVVIEVQKWLYEPRHDYEHWR
ncbi:DarT ssDNA thymidine ADP-ribosyltransferase family protein [Bacillus hominis]|uniref:DarT ssDNA thymidine ADP-ribosyltransferase family protein n=1 Tax=Bacillus hominis TaxID=2817478 RepID=UPI003D65A9DC